MSPLVPGRSVSVRVPASTANLGPGFDTVGLALGLHDRYDAQVTDAPGLVVTLHGEAAEELPRDESHLVVRALREALATCGVPWLDGVGLRLECHNTIPMSAGLGSSAAALVGGFALGFALARGDRLTAPDRALVSTHAGRAEGHPDNASASVHGGMTVSWLPSPAVVRTARPRVHDAVEPLVLLPAAERLATSQARAVLPAKVAHADVVRQAGRAALLVHAMTSEPALLLDATQDWLHQEQRRAAYPTAMAAVDTLRGQGHAAVISGAGPSVLVLTTREVAEVVEAEVRSWRRGWQVLRPGIDRAGLVITHEED